MNNYIPASPLSYLSQMTKSEIPLDDFSSYISNNTAGILHCIAENISNSKNINKLSKRVDKSVNTLRSSFPNSPLYLDSGGFQVLTGKYDIKDVKELKSAYYTYLRDTGEFTRAFILDLPPNDNCFKNWDEVAKWNELTYKEATDPKIADKMIFVFHMLNYESYSIWNNLFDKYHDSFNMFAVGGIAIKQYGKLNRMISYSVPFKVYLEKCLKYGYKELPLHFLGAGQNSTTLTFLFELVREFIKKVYDVSFKIQSDSCQHARLSKGRKFTTIYNGIVYNLSYFSKGLHHHFAEQTKEQYIINEINKFAKENSIDVQIDSIYNDNGSTNQTFYNLLCLYDISIYKSIQKMIRENVSDMIRIYLEDIESFFPVCLDFLKRLNGGRITRNLKDDCQNIIKFLTIIQGKDLNHVELILKQNSSKLFRSNSLLTI